MLEDILISPTFPIIFPTSFPQQFPLIPASVSPTFSQHFPSFPLIFPFFNNEEIPENPIYLHTMPHQETHDDDSIGIRTSTYKFFRHARTIGKNVHLYNLENDPFENFNIADDSQNIIDDMEKILEKYNEDESITQNNQLDDEEQKISKELKKLGYM